MSKCIPAALEGHLLPFNWDLQKVWALNATVETVATAELLYLLDLPFWSSKPNAGMLFDVSPNQVMATPAH